MFRLLISAFLFGAGAVALGAFGAHALENYLIETGRLGTFQTAVEYHFYHTLGVILIALLVGYTKNKKLEIVGWIMICGTIFFSGSLYLLCFTGLNFWVWLTPFGGVLLILSWIFAAYTIWKGQKTNQ
jgi:uncharacterized membrane protein YgdD (TMEM256/DUF423 family)